MTGAQLGAGQFHPDQTGVKGLAFRARIASGDDFPYDRHRPAGASARSYTPGSIRSSVSLETTPSAWDEVEEALGVPFSQALSSRMGNHSGMAAIHPPQGNAEPRRVDDEDLEAAGGGGPWEQLASIMDFLCRTGDDRALSLDKEEPGADEIRADATWRGLSPPPREDMEMRL